MTRLTARPRWLPGRGPQRPKPTVGERRAVEPGLLAVEQRLRAGLADLDDAVVRAFEGPLMALAEAFDISERDESLVVFRTRVDAEGFSHRAGTALVTAEGRERWTRPATDHGLAFLHNALCAFVYRTCEQRAFALVVCPASGVVIGWPPALCVAHDSHEPVVWFHLAADRLGRGSGERLAEGDAPDAVLDVYTRVVSRVGLRPYDLVVC